MRRPARPQLQAAAPRHLGLPLPLHGSLQFLPWLPLQRAAEPQPLDRRRPESQRQERVGNSDHDPQLAPTGRRGVPAGQRCSVN
jgi:hypothetical protein